MAAMSGGALHKLEDFAHEHPLPTVGIGLVIIVIIFWLFSGGKEAAPASTTIVQRPDDSNAAAVAAAKIAADTATANTVTAANAQTALATIAAGVQNTATASATQAAIANANSASAIAQSHDQAQATISGNTTIQSEFSALANVLMRYSDNQTDALKQLSGNAKDIIVNQTNQQSSLIYEKQALDANSFNNAVNQQAAIDQAAIGGYWGLRSDAVWSGHPNVGRWTDALAGTGIASANLSQQGFSVGGGGSNVPQLADYSSNYNTAVTNAASAVNNKDMNTLISALTAQIGNGVTFHAGGAN